MAFEKALVHDLAAATCLDPALLQVVQMAVDVPNVYPNEYLMCT
jgi:hypothetical protein